MDDLHIWNEVAGFVDIDAMMLLEQEGKPIQLIQEAEQVAQYFVSRAWGEYAIDLEQNLWQIRKDMRAYHKKQGAEGLAEEIYLHLLPFHQLLAEMDKRLEQKHSKESKIIPFPKSLTGKY